MERIWQDTWRARLWVSDFLDVGHSQDHLRPKAIIDVALNYCSSCHIHQTCVLGPNLSNTPFLPTSRERKVPR